jgi:16S rRNA (cytosine1402-N4)-methyltransferase
MTDHQHISVLKHEALAALTITAGQWYIDATFGRGGHTREILAQGGQVLAFDCDETAIRYGQEHFQKAIAEGKLVLVHQNFDRIEQVWNELHTQQQLPQPAGILLDFGVSSPQLSEAERGFSFQQDGPLDMRMDHRLGVQAKDLLAILPEKQLAELFWTYGGEEVSRKLARAIVQARTKEAFTTTQQFADFIAKHKPRMGHLHPATKVFQALRIAVNSELHSIESAMPQALRVLAVQGRVVTISFHEGEDRIIKHLFQAWEKQGHGEVVTKKAVQPTQLEETENPRSRSAILRTFIKTKSS